MAKKTILRKVKNSNGIYTCGELDITVDEWKKVLQDKSITNNYKLWLARFYQEVEHKATCKYMGEKYKCSSQTPNSVITKFGIAARKILNRFEVQGTDGKPTYWIIPMKKGQTVSGAFEWTMRDELVQAMEELGMTNPEDFEENINFWSGGIYWGEEKKLDEFSNNNYWQIGWKKDSDNKSAKEAWKNMKRIQIGDLLSFHGYGGTNDLKIYQISKVVDKDEENGKLFIEKLNKKEDVLFHDKAPKMDKGGWFGTLFQVVGKEAINSIFGKYIQGDTQMAQENTLVKKYADLLNNTKNLILTGAPGTGKTFMAKTVAARIILEREINDFDKDLTEEEKKQVESQTGFVQFHPSYDYTDFVEGLRPTDKDGNGNVGFERKDGVFKEFCEKALKNFVDSRKSVDVLQHERTINEIVEDFLNDAVEKKTQFETQTKNPFSVESFTDRKVIVSIPQNEKVKTLPIPIDDILELISNDVQLNIGKDVSEYFNRKWRTQQDSYIYVLTKQIQKNVKENKNNETVTMEKIQAQNFVFIIDEINRGEVAKIFGELFYCVDPGYRGEKGWIKTQYANLETDGNIFDKVLQKKEKDFGHFFIPENVYIIGTMNDIDRSVESMDFAFRRRFSWIEVKASDTVYMLYPSTTENGEPTGLESKELADEAKRRMENLNAAIWNEKEKKGIEGLNEAYHIGASYFLKLNNYSGSQEERFKSLWEYHIKGILSEYLRGNPNGKLDDLKAAYDKREE